MAKIKVRLLFLMLIFCTILFSLILTIFYASYKRQQMNKPSQLKEAAGKKNTLDSRVDEMLGSISYLKEEINALKNNAGGQAKSEVKVEAKKDVEKKTDLPAIPPQAAEKLSGTEKSLARLKDYIRDIEKQNSLLKKENAALQQDLERTINNLKAQFAQKEAEYAGLNALNLSLEDKVNALNDKITVLQQVNSGLEAKFADFNKIKQLLGAAEETRQDIARELEQIKQEKVGLELELRLSKLTNENQINQLNASLNEINLSYEDAKNTIASLSGLANKKESELIEHQGEITLLKENLGIAVSESSALEAALKEKEESIAGLNRALNNTELKLASLQEELNLTKERQRKTVTQLNQATMINTSLQKRISDISKGLDALWGSTSKVSAFPEIAVDTEIDTEKEKADELRKKVEVMLELNSKE